MVMDICYYNDQIKDELHGACDYINRAINYKAAHPEWAAMYAKMSEAQLGHADDLVKIFEDDYKNTTANMGSETIELLGSVRKSLLEMHAKYSAKVMYKHELYKKM